MVSSRFTSRPRDKWVLTGHGEPGDILHGSGQGEDQGENQADNTEHNGTCTVVG